MVEKVTEQEIADAKAVIGRCGIGCEPASAATLAGIRKLTAAGADAAGRGRGRGADRECPEGSRITFMSTTQGYYGTRMVLEFNRISEIRRRYCRTMPSKLLRSLST